MARKVPVSPVRQEAALDAALARAERPALPPGLAARIVAQATALPQLPPETQGMADVPAPEAPAQVFVLTGARQEQEADQSAVRDAVPARLPGRGPLIGVGLAAMAASVAAVLLAGQVGPASNPAVLPAPAAKVDRSLVAQSAGGPETRVPSVGGAAVTHVPAARHMAAAGPGSPAGPEPVPAGQPVSAPSAAPLAAPALPGDANATQLATSGERPAREAAGPQVDPSAAPRVVPRGGLMGPPAPQQAWGFTGGAPGAGPLPGGQSLPGQTTGTMPPPPPGGHP